MLSLKKLLLFALVITASTFAMQLTPSSANALSGSDFRPGRIIDDTVFYNGNTLSATEIQNFLNAKMPSCDTNGQISHTYRYNSGTGRVNFGGSDTESADPFTTTTRAVYGQRYDTFYGVDNGRAPYTCLKDYRQDTPSKAADIFCSAYVGGNKSAAQIIRDVGVSCGISQGVMIVLLEKEQSLVADDWPWKSQYRSATGYGCPDTAPCDAEYYGFFNQVYTAARQFKRYAKFPEDYNYVAQRNNYIQYNPNAACGGSTVFIQNQATAGLYNYTPYQPNAGALAGVSDSSPGGTVNCGAYGNRNFWWLHNKWFDSRSQIMSSVPMTTISQPDPSPALGQTVSYVISFKNNLSEPITFDGVGIVGRAGTLTGPNRDMPWQGPVTIQPGATSEFTFSTIMTETGTLYYWPSVFYDGDYIQYNNWGTMLNVRKPKLTISAPLTSSVTDPVSGQTTTLTASVRNDEVNPIQLGALGIPVRYFDRYNYDATWTSLTIQPGSTQTLSGQVTLDKPGPYTSWVSAFVGNQYLTLSPNLNINAQKLSPNFQLTYIETPDALPAVGQDIYVKFKLKNNLSVPITLDAVGVIGRYSSPNASVNNDLGWVVPGTFAPGEEKSFTTFVSNISQLKNFHAWVAVLHQGTYTQYTNLGFTLYPHKPSLTPVSPLTINGGAEPQLNQSNAVSITLKNNELAPIRYSALGIPVRFYDRYNYDAVWQGPGTFAASGQAGDTITLNGTVFFDKAGPYTVWSSALINGQYFTLSDVRAINIK